jgi:HSP20 family protein
MLPTLRTSRIRSLWNDPFEAMHRELDNLLSLRGVNDGGTAEAVGNYPVDIREDEDHIYVEAEMPGFRKDEVSVTLENGILTLSGQRRAEERKGADHLTERRFTRIQRSFTLPTSVDESKVDAKLSDGVLCITLNKREEVKPRRIEVK